MSSRPYGNSENRDRSPSHWFDTAGLCRIKRSIRCHLGWRRLFWRSAMVVGGKCPTIQSRTTRSPTVVDTRVTFPVDTRAHQGKRGLRFASTGAMGASSRPQGSCPAVRAKPTTTLLRSRRRAGCRRGQTPGDLGQQPLDRVPVERCGVHRSASASESGRQRLAEGMKRLRSASCGGGRRPIGGSHASGAEAEPWIDERRDPLGPRRSGEPAVIGDLLGDSGQQCVEEGRTGRIGSGDDRGLRGGGMSSQVIGERSKAGPVGLVLTGVVRRPGIGSGQRGGGRARPCVGTVRPPVRSRRGASRWSRRSDRSGRSRCG